MRIRPVEPVVMTAPSLLQVAPANGMSASGTIAPPCTEILLNLPPAENPIHCPSGEKTGPIAPVVPGSSIVFDSSSRRVKRRGGPPEELATYAMRVPSGERVTLLNGTLSAEGREISGP